jgi:hypothetical protein
VGRDGRLRGVGCVDDSTAFGWKVISGRAGDLAVRTPPWRPSPPPRLVVSRKGRVNWSCFMGDALSEKTACGREALKAHGASRIGHLHATAERGGLEGKGAVQPRLISASYKALGIACRISRQFGDDSFDASSMISETVENSARFKSASFPAFGRAGSIGRLASRLRRGRTYLIQGRGSSGVFRCRLQTVPKAPIPGLPSARRARAPSARPGPCSPGRRLAGHT